MTALSNYCHMKHVMFNPQHQHIHCIAHVINLAVQAALKSFKATATAEEDDFLDEQLENVVSKIDNNTGILLYKVSFIINLCLINIISNYILLAEIFNS